MLSNQAARAHGMAGFALEHVFSRMESEFQTIVEKIISDMGILSLTEDPLNQQMWAHYPSNGQGFVVGLDAHQSFFVAQHENGARSLLKTILYTDQRTENFWMNLFLVKSSGWAYEREWRRLKKLSECDERNVAGGQDICLWNLSPEIIKTVHFGYAYDAAQIAEGVAKLKHSGAAPEFFSVHVNRHTGVLETNRLIIP